MWHIQKAESVILQLAPEREAAETMVILGHTVYTRYTVDQPVKPDISRCCLKHDSMHWWPDISLAFSARSL